MGLNLRQIEVFRPYDAEFPEPLLLNCGADDDVLAQWRACEIVRIAKLEGQTLGAYAMQRQDELSFRLLGVCTDPARRKQGLGRWLVGHAIGVAESKGGRHLLADAAQQMRFFTRIGFVQTAQQMRFDMIPE